MGTSRMLGADVTYVEHANPPFWWACPNDDGPQGIGPTREAALADQEDCRDRRPWQFYRWFFRDRACCGNTRCEQWIIAPGFGAICLVGLFVIAGFLWLREIHAAQRCRL